MNHNRIQGDSIDFKQGVILRMEGAVSFCMSKSKGFITKYFKKILENVRKIEDQSSLLKDTMN